MYSSSITASKTNSNYYEKDWHITSPSFRYVTSIFVFQEEVKKLLSGHYKFDNKTIKYVSLNVDIIAFLLQVVIETSKVYPSKVELNLELIEIDEDWNTLYVLIQSDLTGMEAENKVETLLNWMHKNYPNLSSVVNFATPF